MKEKERSQERWEVLVVGNNPIELGHVFDRLTAISHKTILAEMAFDLQSVFQRLERFRPQHILIDDNVGQGELHSMLRKFSKRSNWNVPVTVLKTSNYHETASVGVANYVLKKNLTSEALYREMQNSLHFWKAQQYWKETYRKRKGQLARLIKRTLDQI